MKRHNLIAINPIAAVEKQQKTNTAPGPEPGPGARGRALGPEPGTGPRARVPGPGRPRARGAWSRGLGAGALAHSAGSTQGEGKGNQVHIISWKMPHGSLFSNGGSGHCGTRCVNIFETTRQTNGVLFREGTLKPLSPRIPFCLVSPFLCVVLWCS